ncbi:EF-hand domain-containing protein [Hahella sp. CR1]|uniref:EF-hand domain-containing protein n=1 Tax=unclassified Hahella TaxID=2624107 RepID=UPI00244358F8|nr:EF-hand domain-containing protein [Hahella sp. CR1]MDG9669821.1 EF-hand domain-containing protein [Hahella sp. CR1]
MNKALAIVTASFLAALTACSDETSVQTEQPVAEQQPQTEMSAPVQITEAPASSDQYAGPAVEQVFSYLDTDRNSVINKEEAAADSSINESFAQIDIDQNGEISRDEFVVYSGEATAAGSRAGQLYQADPQPEMAVDPAAPADAPVDLETAPAE